MATEFTEFVAVSTVVAVLWILMSRNMVVVTVRHCAHPTPLPEGPSGQVGAGVVGETVVGAIVDGAVVVGADVGTGVGASVVGFGVGGFVGEAVGGVVLARSSAT